MLRKINLSRSIELLLQPNTTILFMKKLFGLFLLMGSIACVRNQVSLQTSQLPESASIRAIAFGESRTWVSGSAGSIFYSDNLEQWTTVNPPVDTLDYRALYAKNKNEVVVASAGYPAQIYRTINAGAHWELVYEDTIESAFFDAITVDSSGLGYVLGDPREGAFCLYETRDFGASWKKLPAAASPKVVEGEVAYAASNTNMVQIQEGLIFISGGAAGSFVHAGVPSKGQWKKEMLPLKAGEGCGAFTMAQRGDNIMVGGGCYAKIQDSEGNFLFSDNLGTQWFQLPQAPKGYISGLAFMGKTHLIGVGDLGIQVAPKRSKRFEYLTQEKGWNVVACRDSVCVAAGKNGKVAVIR